ncbi:MAG: 30S ribosomal protein S3 [Clostridia bacterium]|nr:30S ribosomal protein S3 [Clostridia bacterium]
MGQKIHPKGLRIGIIRDWDARWFARRGYADLLQEDLAIRSYVKSHFKDAGVSQVEIERYLNRVKVTIHTAKPGMVIGRGGAEVENLQRQLSEMTGKQVHVDIAEIKNPELDAQLVAEGVALQLERRVAFRRAMKQAAQRCMRSRAKGVKIMVSGRLGGAEMSRTEWTAEGSVPLHTLRADIDYGFAEASTTYGRIGVKVWIYRGDVPTRRAGEEAGEPEAVEAAQREEAAALEAQPAAVEEGA